jgi:hypothetical protein
MVSDLDRCEHGRHEGDACSSCGGPSKGNPHLSANVAIGYSIDATPYFVPPCRALSNFEAWASTPVWDEPVRAARTPMADADLDPPRWNLTVAGRRPLST